MVDRRRAVRALLLMAVLLAGLAGCTRAKPPRERPPFDGVPTFEAPTPTEELPATPIGQPATPTAAEPTLAAQPAQPQPEASATPAPIAAEPVTPAATATPVAQATSSLGETTYTVQPGDTALTIAERLGVSAVELMFRNGLRDPNALTVGQTLIVPAAHAEGSGPTSGGTPAAGAPASGGGVKTIQHRVMPGETLYRIALLYNSTVEEILAWNPNVTSPERLISGTYLVVPVGSAGRARSHTVRPGETLAAIAAQYGVTVNALLKVNNLANANVIYAGQLLIIPE